MRVFIDTGAWLALAYSDDQYNEEAIIKYNKILNKSYLLITSDYIIDETITRIRLDIGHKQAVKYIKKIKKAEEKKLIQVEKISNEIIEAAIELFKKYDDQIFSFTNCTSFVLCQKKNIDKVFAFDRDFKIMNLELL